MGKPQNHYQNLITALSTFFYIGYLPLIPGTFASIAGIFLFYVIKGNFLIYIVSIFSLTLTGILIGEKAENIFQRKDCPHIVIDEVLGILLGLIFIPYDIKAVIIGFVIFRILDTLKPYPASILQNLKGGLGIVGDDIVAGLYTNIILQVALRLASFKIS